MSGEDSRPAGAGDGRGGRLGSALGLLFRDPPRRLPGGRTLQTALRAVHIVAMGLVLGGVAYEAPAASLHLPLLLTGLSGVGLLAIDLYKSCAFLYQGSGVAVLLKLLLLGLGQAWPALRLEGYLAATAVAALGSHMTADWRHYSLLHRRVLGGSRRHPSPAQGDGAPAARP